MKAIKDKKSVKILYLLKNGTEKWIKCHPVRLEYSQRDDKFRLIAASKAGKRIVNLAKIKKCESMDVTEPLQTKNLDCVMHDKRTVELLLKDERQALERVMMQLSIYEKITEKLDDTTYKIAVTYEVEDEIEIGDPDFVFWTKLKSDRTGAACGTNQKQIKNAEKLWTMSSQRALSGKMRDRDWRNQYVSKR
ncbi:MAG: hypothetical protein ACLT1J_08195 [Mediterraneibacter gnavus]